MALARSLIAGFLNSCELHPHRVAVEIDETTLTYRELRRLAASIAATLIEHSPASGPTLTAVFAERSVTAYAGLLGTLFRGHGYVPINPGFPPERSAKMLRRAGCRAIVTDQNGLSKLDGILQDADTEFLIVLPDVRDVGEIANRWPAHHFLGRDELSPAENWRPVAVEENAVAYLLFTSGSTGEPKGVMVGHRNVTRFIDVVVERYSITKEDRLSQLFELVFDLSVFDMFVAWEVGACVCCPNRSQLLMPAQFVKDKELSVWFSVPSTAVMMKKLGFLEPAAFPGLRVSLFCGEALTADVAEAWAQAASNSIVENLYGPTELTLACTLYRWDNWWSPKQCENGIVPIGWPFPGMLVLVADENLVEVSPGEAGELLMSGPQLTLGYWNDKERTEAVFVVPPGQDKMFYRTGDRVRRPLDDGPMTYLGRVDHQVQVRGYRVELGEVEAALREAASVDQAIAIGWPATPGVTDHLIAFLECETIDAHAVRKRLERRLPKYMVPRAFHAVRHLPLNTNGKVDRHALAALLEDRATQLSQ